MWEKQDNTVLSGMVSQLSVAIDNLVTRMDRLEERVIKTNRPKDFERFAQISLCDRSAFGDVRVSDWEEFERPFDNVRAIFDEETGNLKYIGLIDDLPF